MNKFQRSWQLLRCSLSVIGRNKQLLVFPIVVFTCTLAIVFFFLLPPVLRPTGYAYTSAEHWQAIGHSLFQSPGAAGDPHNVSFTPLALVYLAFLYLVTMFIATFFNVAFYHEILTALSGQPVSVGRGLKFATSKLKSILLWTLFAGLVGIIIKIIEEKLDVVGRIIGRFIGIAWSVAAVFAIPVIVYEERNSNPIKVLQTSAFLLKRAWGEALIGYVGLGLVNVLVLLGSLVLLVGGMVVFALLNSFVLMGLTAATWLLALFCWSYITGVASHVYRGALYIYASQGIVVEPYNYDMLEQAWKYKKQKGTDQNIA